MKRRSYADRAHNELAAGLSFAVVALLLLVLRLDLVAGGSLLGAVIFLFDALLWLHRWKAEPKVIHVQAANLTINRTDAQAGYEQPITVLHPFHVETGEQK